MLQSAIFIDAENVYKALVKKNTEAAKVFLDNPGRLMRGIEDLEIGLPSGMIGRRLISRRYYAPPFFLAGKTDTILNGGIEVVSSANPSKNNKNSADIKIVIDCMNFLHVCPNIQEYIILADDTDYSHLSIELRRAGKNVIFLSQSRNVKPHSRFCDHLFRISTLENCLASRMPVPSVDKSTSAQAIPESPEPVIVVPNLAEAEATPQLSPTPDLSKALEVLALYADARQGFLPLPMAMRILVDTFEGVKEHDLLGYENIESFANALAHAFRDEVIYDQQSSGLRILNERLDLSHWGFPIGDQFTEVVKRLLIWIDDPIPFIPPVEWRFTFKALHEISQDFEDGPDDLQEFSDRLNEKLFQNGIEISLNDAWNIIDSIIDEGGVFSQYSSQSDFAHCWRLAIWEQSGRVRWLNTENGAKFLVQWFSVEGEDQQRAASDLLSSIADYSSEDNDG
jgi:hypothetical protein